MHSINLAITRVMIAVSDLKVRLTEERGQDLLEYALLGGLIAAAIVALVTIFNPALQAMATNIGYCLDFSGNTTCDPGF